MSNQYIDNKTVTELIAYTISQGDENKNIEIEVRFSSYFADGKIPKNMFFKLYFGLGQPDLVTEFTDYIYTKPNYFRIRKDSAGNLIQTHKIGGSYYKNNQYKIKLNWTLEQNVSTKMPKQKYNHIIENTRSRFNLDYGYFMDLTEKKHGSNIEYVVELEWSNGDPKFTHLNDQIDKILHLLLDTEIIYTYQEYHDLIHYLNSTFSVASPNVKTSGSKYTSLSQIWFNARNLHLTDMVYGGLLGNKDTTYRVTHKADGERKMLIFREDGIWLFMTPYMANKVVGSDFYLEFDNSSMAYGIICEAEYIPKNSPNIFGKDRIGSKYLLLIFDTLATPELGSDILAEPGHSNRLNASRRILEQIDFRSDIIDFKYKTFTDLTNLSKFYDVMEIMFQESESQIYETDGFIFMPSYMPYNYASMMIKAKDWNLKDRILTQRPDICKWKPPSKMSIDLIVGPKLYLSLIIRKYSGRRITENIVPFTGYGTPFRINPIKVDVYPVGSILEIAKDDDDIVILKQRFDKTKPNSPDVIRDNWILISSPIEKNTFTGNNLVLMRKYHNNIKNYILSIPDKGKTMLDIGSGRGGDLHRWNKFGYSRIVAVEPNQDNIDKFIQRYNSRYTARGPLIVVRNMQDLSNIKKNAWIVIVNAKAENSELIKLVVDKFVGDKVDVVSLMLSLQLITPTGYTSIHQNLKNGGDLLFFTTDKEAVDQIFTENGLTQIEHPQANVKYTTNGELIVNFPGTIVEDQTEVPVNITNFIGEMSNYGILKINTEGDSRQNIYRSDGEQFLSKAGLDITKMYSYGVLTRIPDLSKEDMNIFSKLYLDKPEFREMPWEDQWNMVDQQI